MWKIVQSRRWVAASRAEQGCRGESECEARGREGERTPWGEWGDGFDERSKRGNLRCAHNDYR